MYNGSCLCRRIQFELTAHPGAFGLCHCVDCRKSSGSAFAADAPVARSSFRLLSGSQDLREFESAPGSVRAFCGHCGSPVYAYRALDPDVLDIRLGSLDTPFARQPLWHACVAAKAPWNPITDALPKYAGPAAAKPPMARE